MMLNRPDSFLFPGGDTVQMLRTKEALERLGVIVDVDTSETPAVSGFDVVHVFNTLAMPAAYYQVLVAKSAGMPVVYSTIYWNTDSLPPETRDPLEGVTRALNATLARLTGRELVSRSGHAGKVAVDVQREAALLAADCLLPNAQMELDQIREAFPRVHTPAHVVPNGVSERITDGVADRFRARTGIAREFVLCLANVSPRKNQLRLSTACRSLGLPLVMAGGCSERNRAYLEKCLRVGQGSVTYVGALEEAEEVADALAACRVHALPSSVETPGLASLEAAACGKNVVVCDRGSVREYFGDDAYYCDYYSLASIAEALSGAWNAGQPEALASRIMAQYTWTRAAEETLKAYEQVLAKYRPVHTTGGSIGSAKL